jgi:hypothetical protein
LGGLLGLQIFEKARESKKSRTVQESQGRNKRFKI